MCTQEEGRRGAEVWLAQQAGLRAATVTRNIPRGDTVHDVTIEGRRFSAGVCDNSLLIGANTNWSCALGVASINNESQDGPGWAICKYWNQRQVRLDLTEAGRRALALEFGLAIVPEVGYAQMRKLREADLFYVSPAFSSLIAWATKHPGKIRKLSGDSYLGLWPLAAIRGQRVDMNKENIELARNGYRKPGAAGSSSAASEST